ncbi:MAG: hypothetical protein WBL02_00700 [Methanomethylovorans sp.]|uniref:hypothetical protein n=1 Tax=Methanomethylovorans sp. TaxID=2758717 RepID=UPI000A4A4E97|nr:hypothetical protein [Methanomethylovorans sp.]
MCLLIISSRDKEALDVLNAGIVRVEYDRKSVLCKIRANIPDADELIAIPKRGY